LLLALSFYLKKSSKHEPSHKAKKIVIPFFALGFVAVVAFNSFQLLPAQAVDAINIFDTYLLTMAMTALGLETKIKQMKVTGWAPFQLAFILFLWLMAGGYAAAMVLQNIL